MTSARGVAGPAPYTFSISGLASWCEDLWKKEKKNPELVAGVYQLARGIISSYFQYLDRAVKETA